MIKPSKILDLFDSKAAMIFVVSAIWFTKGRLDQIDAQAGWINHAQPIMEKNVKALELLEARVHSLEERLANETHR